MRATHTLTLVLILELIYRDIAGNINLAKRRLGTYQVIKQEWLITVISLS